MKRELIKGLRLSLVLMGLFGGIYPLLVSVLGSTSPGAGNGLAVRMNNRVVGYELIGQRFDNDLYFWSRPSATGYNAAGSGGSNKAASNAGYISVIRARLDTFLLHHPYTSAGNVPVSMLTASGSGIDPHISPEAALLQVKRVASARHLSEKIVHELVLKHTEAPWLNLFGAAKVNVVRLNVALDDMEDALR